jgi:hypothetical protein
MTLKTEVQILGDASSLERATRRASGDLDKFGKKSKTFATKMTGFGAGLVGGALGAGLVNLGQDLFSFAQSSVQAAIDDNKAQGILANTLKNTVRNGEKQVAGVESQISAWETLYGVLDDNIRPAYGILLKSTHSVKKSNELMQIALDGSAESGKPLSVVATALGKAFNGSNTSLLKLNTSLKGSKNPIDDYAKSVQGAAETAKKNDPFATWQVTLANIQENVGTAILPKLQEFAGYLASPEGQAGVKLWTATLINGIKLATDLLKTVSSPNFSLDLVNAVDSAIAQGLSPIPGTGLLAGTALKFGQTINGARPPIGTYNNADAVRLGLAPGRPWVRQPLDLGIFPNKGVTQNIKVIVNNNGKNIDGNDIVVAIKKHVRLYGNRGIQ